MSGGVRNQEPSRSRVNVYVDGFNLYKGALEKSPRNRWIDLPSLAKSLANEEEFDDIYYFTAAVKQRFPGDKAPNRQHAFLRVLADQKVKIVFGKFRKDVKQMRFISKSRASLTTPELDKAFGFTQAIINRAWQKADGDYLKAIVFKMEEKGSDVNLASYLLRDSYLSNIDKAVVITGDSDLITPIQFAADAGVEVRVVVPDSNQKADGLYKAASSFRRIRNSDLETNQLPRAYITKSGSNIVRPSDWD